MATESIKRGNTYYNSVCSLSLSLVSFVLFIHIGLNNIVFTKKTAEI